MEDQKLSLEIGIRFFVYLLLNSVVINEKHDVLAEITDSSTKSKVLVLH